MNKAETVSQFCLKLTELGEEIDISPSSSQETLKEIQEKFPHHQSIIFELWKETAEIKGFSVLSLLYPLLHKNENVDAELLMNCVNAHIFSPDYVLWSLDNMDEEVAFDEDWLPFAEDGTYNWVLDSSNSVYCVPKYVDLEAEKLCDNFDLLFERLIHEVLNGDFELKKEAVVFERNVGNIYSIVYKNRLRFEVGSSEQWEEM